MTKSDEAHTVITRLMSQPPVFPWSLAMLYNPGNARGQCRGAYHAYQTRYRHEYVVSQQLNYGYFYVFTSVSNTLVLLLNLGGLP